MNQVVQPTIVRSRSELLVGSFLILTTLAVFARACTGGFVYYDDNEYVTDNVHLKAGLSRAGLRWALTARDAANWHPLTWMSLLVDHQLYGLDPWGYHLTNVLLHAANVFLLFRVLRRMTGDLWKSAFVAACFAVHPLRAESVAWVAERKDVLSSTFWMLTLWAYARYAEKPNLRHYGAVLLMFALGLMAKPMLVTLPFVLLLLDFWPLRRLRPPALARATDREPLGSSWTREWSNSFACLFVEKFPLLVLATLSSVLTVVAQGKAVASLERFPLTLRCMNALVSWVLYVRKTFWPVDLAAYYPYSKGIPVWQALGAGSLLIGCSIVALKEVGRLPYLAVGWFWYLGTLVPVIGLVQVGSQALADRYSYIPTVGLFLVIAWGIPDLVAHWRYRALALAGLSAATLVVCMELTWVQIGYWHDGVVLWQHALRVTNRNFTAHFNLGKHLRNRGKLEEAIQQDLAALRINPGSAEAYNELGSALLAQGKSEGAVRCYSIATQIDPRDIFSFNNLGWALMKQGKLEQAKEQFHQALRLRPDYALAYNNLGEILERQGKLAQAIAYYRRAVRAGRPEDIKFRCNLAAALQDHGEIEAARVEYRRALQIDPAWPEAADGTAWSLATDRDPNMRDGALALKYAKQACQATGRRDPAFLDTLAAAHAELGQFEDALRIAREALELASAANQVELAEQIQGRLRLYEKRKPFRVLQGEERQ